MLEWTENVCCCRCCCYCCFLLLLPNTLMQNLYGIQCQWHVLPLKLQLPLNSNSSSSSLHCLQRCSCRCRLSYFERNRFNYVSCAASHGLVHRPIQTDCCHSNSCCVPASTVCALGLLECAHVHFMYHIVSVSVSILSLFPLPLSLYTISVKMHLHFVVLTSLLHLHYNNAASFLLTSKFILVMRNRNGSWMHSTLCIMYTISNSVLLCCVLYVVNTVCTFDLEF